MERFRFAIACILLAALCLPSGCSRNRYRLRADRETTSILVEKSVGAPWAIPPGFTIYPHPLSRFYDPTNLNDPLLPIPAPRLYAYQLPPLSDRRAGGDSRLPSGEAMAGGPQMGRPWMAPALPNGPPGAVMPVSYQPPDELPPGSEERADQISDSLYGQTAEGGVLTVTAIPKEVWDSIPDACLRRMFEFESVRSEYRRTFEAPPAENLLDQSPRLALENILELALINSREYQRRKEILYSVALQLTIERFDYDMKFSPFGNGTDANFVHNRTGGITENTLSVPTTVNGEKLLATGGDLLARFANDVVLTFNGPDGFAADVGSELLLSLSQNVLQRDIILEGLTQSERDVVYAARDFARFRKIFFRDLAARYYSLLLTYRGIEIDSQDYFTNLRAFNQGQAEYQAGRLPRIQVDQFEQNALRSRSSLIGRCNSLESALDNLKIAIGIPPETPINLDLTELEDLTQRDEATVTAELVRRARRNLLQEQNSTTPDRTTLLNGAIDLTRRLLNLAPLRSQVGGTPLDTAGLELQLAELLVDEAQILVRFNRETLVRERQSQPPVPERLFQRIIDLVDSQLIFIGRHSDLQVRRQGRNPASDMITSEAARLDDRLQQLRNGLFEAVEQRNLEIIPQLVMQAERLLADSDALMMRVYPQAGPIDEEAERRRTLQQTDQLLATSAGALADSAEGLPEINIGMDEAMLTALSQRFDLMNERGALADVWRGIKFAGDDLRSILNLNATQVVRTRSDVNRPFDFTFDDSQTRLSASFDAPLNRKAQRNTFRQSLINYQVGLRSLIELEDGIKLSIRDDLRNLQLDREQYRIAVASAALANERVVSTRLQLQLGIENVAARDFLEAQQAYTASLSSVASEHIGYIVDRIDLFLDLELLVVDDSGFWPELYNEQQQPTVDYTPRGDGPYGQLPRRTLPSHRIRRMLDVPYGEPMIFAPDSSAEGDIDLHTETIHTPGADAPSRPPQRQH